MFRKSLRKPSNFLFRNEKPAADCGRLFHFIAGPNRTASPPLTDRSGAAMTSHVAFAGSSPGLRRVFAGSSPGLRRVLAGIPPGQRRPPVPGTEYRPQAERIGMLFPAVRLPGRKLMRIFAPPKTTNHEHRSQICIPGPLRPHDFRHAVRPHGLRPRRRHRTRCDLHAVASGQSDPGSAATTRRIRARRTAKSPQASSPPGPR